MAAHIREKGSPGATTRSLKEETIRGVPSKKGGQKKKDKKRRVIRKREVCTTYSSLCLKLQVVF